MPRISSPILVLFIQFFLLIEGVTALVQQSWSALFVAVTTLVLTFLPNRFAGYLGITLPGSVLTGIVIFLFATLFLGEVEGFYNRFWWWDVALHFLSAVSFGLMGFLAIFMLFEGDRYAAPPWALAVLAFCVGLSIGALWEVFEFSMDQLFGTNMQKSGLVDTMKDLIVDTIGAAIGAVTGFFYLKGRQVGGLGHVMEQFVQANRRFYGKLTGRDDGD
ncbi:hypothetical protein [Vannielia sp.]|uniref:hypothetical protein n=1 Tax=Vannielia sp. TaxID=2813045 RepID=UPI002612A6D6|nr:hypothetical protein [Vannielia sp.]MDF1873078.1 hypothetical protein [Vannielia sp.]